MFIEDIEVGMKVVPVSRTITMFSGDLKVKPATHSKVWRKACEAGQSYLVVTQVNIRHENIMCNLSQEIGGDWFKEYDLEEWVENS